MPQFLTFTLVAPMASFGSIAVGERRGGWDRPGRSAVLGLIGACLGVERDDAAGQAVLASDYGLGVLCRHAGALLADYQTAQVPPTQRNRRFPTRAAELRAPGQNTILSRRDYRTGAWHLACLWLRGASTRWPLQALAAAMEQPVFTPYLGRKGCPLGLPLAPHILDAETAVAALLDRDHNGREAALRSRWLPRDAHERTIALDVDGVAPDDPRRIRVETRRDQPRSRERWQFDLRREVVLDPGPAPSGEP